MQNTELIVTGMMCEKCVEHVTKALLSVPGVQTAKVSLPESRALVQHENAEVSALIAAVEAEDYEAKVA